MRMQASLLSTAALTAEVGVLKQDLERTKQELGLAKRRLEEEEENSPLPGGRGEEEGRPNGGGRGV